MDENSVSFQLLLIFLSFITLGSERQISVFKQCQKILRSLFCVFLVQGGGGGSMRMRSDDRLGVKHGVTDVLEF